MEKILNAPIAETFGWLHVGGTKAQVPAASRNESVELVPGEMRTVILRDGEDALSFRAELGEDSCLHLIQIRDGKTSGTAVNDVSVRCGRNAQFHWYRVILSGEKTFDNCSVTLEGDGSKFSADVGYHLSGEENYDINCEAIHLGKRTDSRITSSGVLADRAGKLLRGTIDFRSGCAGSTGEETEDVLLMDETVRNRTVPVILCAEEDVAGNHGATIGRPDEGVLYYMESRGIGREEAFEMLAGAKVDAVIGKLPDVRLREELREELG